MTGFYTLAQFLATGQELTQSEYAAQFGYNIAEDLELQADSAILAYGDGYWIEKRKDGNFWLLLERDEWLGADLAAMQRRLYMYTVNDWNPLANVSAQFSDLDLACAIIQRAIGQNDGGIAGIVFSDIETGQWEVMGQDARKSRLLAYIETELNF